jgi:hypothetical protein
MLCVVIPISMSCIPISMCCHSNLFYVSYFKFLCNYFLKFIVHKINFEMVKYEMMMLTRKKKTDVADADMAMCWIP